MILLTIASAHGLFAQEASPESQAVRMLVFYDQECDDCEVPKEEILPALRVEYGFPIEARYMDVTDTTTYAILRDLEGRYQDKGNGLRSRAILLLVIYNIMFVLPLVMVFSVQFVWNYFPEAFQDNDEAPGED